MSRTSWRSSQCRNPSQWLHPWWQAQPVATDSGSLGTKHRMPYAFSGKARYLFNQAVEEPAHKNPAHARQAMPGRTMPGGAPQISHCNTLKDNQKAMLALQYLHSFPDWRSCKCHNSSYSSAGPKVKLFQCQLDAQEGEADTVLLTWSSRVEEQGALILLLNRWSTNCSVKASS